MNQRRTFSILQRFSRILAVTATYFGLPQTIARIPMTRLAQLPLRGQRR